MLGQCASHRARTAAIVQDYDPHAPLEDQGGMHALHEVVSKLAFIDDTSPKSADGRTEDAVQLMTLHKCKGLEFSVVVLVGLDNNGLFRGEAGLADLEAVDQATNLVYVGVTRTENLLVVSAVESDPLPDWRKFAKGGRFGAPATPAEPSVMLDAMYREFDVQGPQVRGADRRCSLRLSWRVRAFICSSGAELPLQGWSRAKQKLRALADLLAAEGRPLLGA